MATTAAVLGLWPERWAFQAHMSSSRTRFRPLGGDRFGARRPVRVWAIGDSGTEAYYSSASPPRGPSGQESSC